MTQQDDITQRVLTGDEINTAIDWPAANTTMRAENDRAMAREVEAAVLRKLSKLRAPVTDAGNWQQYRLRGSDENAEQVIERERRAYADLLQSVMDKRRDQASAPVAEPGTMEEIHRQERERSPWVLPKDPTLPDSAPVAGEAKNYPGENVAERLDNMADDQPPGSQAQSDLYAAATIWRKHIAHRAAPQASEAVRTQVLAALESAQRFIRNGIEFGYIRMPDADTPDPAHRTPSLIDAAIRSLKTQADKDGGGDA